VSSGFFWSFSPEVSALGAVEVWEVTSASVTAAAGAQNVGVVMHPFAFPWVSAHCYLNTEN